MLGKWKEVLIGGTALRERCWWSSTFWCGEAADQRSVVRGEKCDRGGLPRPGHQEPAHTTSRSPGARASLLSSPRSAAAYLHLLVGELSLAVGTVLLWEWRGTGEGDGCEDYSGGHSTEACAWWTQNPCCALMVHITQQGPEAWALWGSSVSANAIMPAPLERNEYLVRQEEARTV